MFSVNFRNRTFLTVCGSIGTASAAGVIWSIKQAYNAKDLYPSCSRNLYIKCSVDHLDNCTRYPNLAMDIVDCSTSVAKAAYQKCFDDNSCDIPYW